MAGGANQLTSILYALCANSSIFVAKLWAALTTGSGAMLAESIHSLADAGNQVLLLWGVKTSKQAPSEEYPLGYGKSLYFWSFVVAVVLFTMGGLFSLYEGWHKFQHPEPITSPWIAIGVLVFAIAAESVAMWGCLREVNKVRRGRSYWRWFRESRHSALIVIFGEDLAALLGLTFALIAVGLTMLTGNPIYDAIGTLIIGVLLIVIAVGVAIEVKALLIGQGAEPHVRREMLTFLRQRAEVNEIYSLITLHMGEDVMVAVKARMAPATSGKELVTGINRVETAFRDAFPQTAWLFFEPDITD